MKTLSIMQTHCTTQQRSSQANRVRRVVTHPNQLAGIVVLLISALLFSGCSTPDLKPFSDASKTLSTSVKTGGEMAIKPLAKTPLWVNNTLVQAGDPNHPYKDLQTQWATRVKAMDAVLVYSASLQAINEASAHRKENAKALVGSVQQLAAAVPGYGAAFNKAGDLIVQGLAVTVEVKAWHDMRRAVASADPAVQLVAKGLKQDLQSIARVFEAPLNDQITRFGAATRPVIRLEEALRQKRDVQRTAVEGDPADTARGNELTRLEGLYATAAADLNQMRAERAKIEEAVAQGKDFFANSVAAVDAWADAHSELMKAFEENRMPNFTLLAARAEELSELVNQFKKK